MTDEQELQALAWSSAEILAPIFAEHDWTWATTDNKVPDIEQIADTVLGMLHEVRPGGFEAIGGGRLWVDRFREGGDHVDEYRVRLEVGSVYLGYVD